MITAAKTDSRLFILQMPGSSSKTILDSIRQTDSAKAAALEKQLADDKQVIAQLLSGKDRMSASAKAAAAEKVKRIKEEIKMLLMMGGDPKVIARRIAQLAKNLAAAAREYAAGASSLPDNEAVASAGSDNNTSTTAQNDSPASESAAAPAASADTVADPEKAENGASIATDAASMTSTDAAHDKIAQQYSDILQQKLKTDLLSRAAETSSKTAAAEADRQFAQEVRTLVSQLKLLARQQKQRPQQTGDHSADREIDQALADAEKSISGLRPAGMTVTA